MAAADYDCRISSRRVSAAAGGWTRSVCNIIMSRGAAMCSKVFTTRKKKCKNTTAIIIILTK